VALETLAIIYTDFPGKKNQSPIDLFGLRTVLGQRTAKIGAPPEKKDAN